MSLKVCVFQPKVGVAESSSFPHHPSQPIRQMQRFSGETQAAVITGLGTVMRMKAKDNVQALQPAGTGQKEGRELPASHARPGGPGRALSHWEGSSPVGSSPADSRWELAHFWQCGWESGKERRLQGKQHKKGWSSARFQPEEPHNLPACKRSNSTEVCSWLWGDFWERNRRDLPSCIQQSRSMTSEDHLTQQHFPASGACELQVTKHCLHPPRQRGQPRPKGSFWEAVVLWLPFADWCQ